MHHGALTNASDEKNQRHSTVSVPQCKQVLFTRTLRKHLGDAPVHAFVVHPGEVDTEIARDIPSLMFRIHKAVMPLFLFSGRHGAPPASSG
jgi:NAD(P)-dependent dehydrogenase (short-subunit alcohol dehydrogenase family)